MEATGKVIRVMDEQFIGDDNRKREIVLEIGDRYPKPVAFEFWNDRADLLTTYSEGQTVTVEFSLSGRYWEKGDRYFVSLSGWKIAAQESGSGGSGKTGGLSDDEIPF